MIRIGDFARLGMVSVVTLRHYDDIGLLKPASIDTFTGYRFYSATQLARLNRIIALKDLGFSLKQIEQVLDSLSVEQLVGMLKLKQAESKQVLADEEARLMRIVSRIMQITMEDELSNYDVVLKAAPAVLIASRRVTVPTNDEVPRYLGEAFVEAYGLIKAQGGKDVGPCFAVWHQSADVHTNEDVEAAVPVDRELASTERVQVYALPGAQVISVIHQGNFSDFPQAHAALLRWMESNGYLASGPYREIYVQHDPDAAQHSVTEIQYPVERA